MNKEEYPTHLEDIVREENRAKVEREFIKNMRKNEGVIKIEIIEIKDCINGWLDKLMSEESDRKTIRFIGKRKQELLQFIIKLEEDQQ